MDLAKIYSVECKQKETRPGCWNYQIVSIFQTNLETNEKHKIGEYTRNYSCFGESTFAPFELNGKHLALYSADYTCTRIMELPSCKDIGGEEAVTNGFCPVELFVPTYFSYTYESSRKDQEGKSIVSVFVVNNPTDKDLKDDSIKIEQIQYYKYGFVSGCHWGDDSSWKIEYLDLSKADEGIIKRDARFGTIELAYGQSLRKAINMDDIDTKGGSINFNLICRFDIESGEFENPF